MTVQPNNAPHDDITCPYYNCLFSPTSHNEVLAHKRYHRFFINGVIIDPRSDDNIIYEDKKNKILVVSPKSSTTQRKRAERVAKRAKIGTEYDFLSYYSDDTAKENSPLVFISVVERYAAAFLVLRTATDTMTITWDEYLSNSIKQYQAISREERWCIGMIWVINRLRHKGYAKQILEASSYFTCTPLSEYSWSVPISKLGIPLAQTISPNTIMLSSKY